MSNRFGICFQTIISAIIKPYYWTAYRIRTWGRLPWKRGATLVLCNHQHDLDNTPTIAAMQLAGPWNKPIYSASGRRMFEPGFLGMRLPWLRPLLRRVDATKIFLAIGMLPIENEIRSRFLASLAWWVYMQHGEVPLAQIFAPDVIANFDPQAARLTARELFGKRWFAKANTMRVPMKSLLEPYRSEILAQTRSHLEPDYRRFEQVLAAGNTLYLTPEGHYSADGRLGRLQSALGRFLPFAKEIYLLAISYDVFAGRRLSCLVRILPPQDPNDLETSMCAPRPITVSQLIASWLLETDRAFSRADAIAAVRARLASLPPTAFIDPELSRNPDKRTNAAIDGLLRLGALEERAGTYQLTQQRRHPQFPQVEDIIAFQARFFSETLDALERLAGRRS